MQERRAEHPDLHVYHYAPYETTAVKRLMGTHHTREAEVDEWLRAEVFVDLYAVVRAAVRIGAESYSLKQVEHLYLERDAGEVMNAADSIVEYEAYLDDRSQARLDAIERYNEEDCRSTLELHRWLEEQRADADAQWGPNPARRGEGRHRARGGQRTRGDRRRPVRSASSPTRPTTSTRPAGCSRRCSTGTGARPSPTGGCTSPAST